MTSHLYQVRNMFKSWGQRKTFDPQIGLFIETCKEEESDCYYARNEKGILWEQKMSACKKWSYIAQIPFCSILQLVINANMAFNKKKFVQFVVILYLLAHGKPMTNFENMKYFYEFVEGETLPKKTWVWECSLVYG